jgi:hypothetical protein
MCGLCQQRDRCGAGALRLAGQRARASERSGGARRPQSEARRGATDGAATAVRDVSRRAQLSSRRGAPDVRGAFRAGSARTERRSPRPRRPGIGRHQTRADEMMARLRIGDAMTEGSPPTGETKPTSKRNTVSAFRRTKRSVFDGQNGRRLLRPTTLLLMDHCRQPRALPRSWPTPWSCTPRRATARRCLGSTVALGQSEIGKSTIRAVSRPAASSFKKATSMPEREYAICRDYCS